MMDHSKYKKMFIDETIDNLAIINDTLPLLGEELEEGVEDPVQILFRAFHSIKGMSSSMNYRNVQEVSHKLEDLLEEVRKGNLDVSETIKDLLYEGAEILERLVDVISGGSGEKVETNPFLKRLLMASTITPSSEEVFPLVTPDDEVAPLSELPQEDLAALNQEGKEKYKISVTIRKDSISPPARAYLLIQSLKEKSDVSKTIPSLEDITAGKMEFEFTAFVVTELSEAEIRGIINAATEIEKYDLEHIKVDFGARDGEPAKLRIRSPEEEASVPVLKYRKPGAVKVESFTIDSLLNLVGEMFIRQNQLRDIAKTFRSQESTESVNHLEKLVRKLYKEMMTLRLVPVAMLSDMFPRIVREVLKGTEKKVELLVKGKEIKLDRTIIEKLGDPFIHMIRNSLDHGVEEPAERVKAGKGESAKVIFEASRERDNIIMVFSDDGRGLDVEKIKQKIVSKGIADREYLDGLEDSDVFRYIFSSGLSTSEKVTSVSGRGVGMDIVKNAVEELGGKITVSSVLGEGCSFRLQIPMSIAIIKTFRIKLNDDVYAVPVNKILHTIEIPRSSLRRDRRGVFFDYRDERIPVSPLKTMLRYETRGERLKEIVSLLVVESGDTESGKTAFIVDSLLSIYDTVIKSLSNPLKKVEIYSGVTISEKGELILILDVEKILTQKR